MNGSESKTCACLGKNLEKFVQPVILSLLNEKELNGYQIIQKIPDYATFKNRRPDPTGVYRYLKLMEDRGLVLKSDGTDGLYSLTGEGYICLQHWKLTLAKYNESLAELTSQL